MTQEKDAKTTQKQPPKRKKAATQEKEVSEKAPKAKKQAASGRAEKIKNARPADTSARMKTSPSLSESDLGQHSRLDKTDTEAQSHAEHNAPKSLTTDFDALSEYLVEVSGKSQEVVREFFAKANNGDGFKMSEKTADPLNIGEAFQEMMQGLSSDPGTVMQRQFNLWGDYAKLMATMSRRMAGENIKPAILPAAGDKRFKHEAWEENHLLDFVKQSYLIYAKWLNETVGALEGMDEHEQQRAKFYTRQFLDAISPTNFPMLNPEVVEETLASKGENLMKGVQNLLEDIERGNGELAIRQADLDYFKLGENIATTPGKVVFQNDIFQLIQYNPTTEEVAKRPLLIFPPWINKYYILDLQAKNSFIRWMVEQGRTVFVVSWVNPTADLREKTFEDYINEGLFAALDAVQVATGEQDVDAIGYCIGGTMLATALCLMAERHDRRIKTATFFTAQADFQDAGELLLFVDDEQLNSIEKQMDAAGGVLEGRSMATTFNMLRSNDLIWQFVIDNYMKGKDPAKFDLLYWNSDATRMSKNVHLFYLREYYQKNRLATGSMWMGGKNLDLGKVSIPIYMQAGETDHIAPANSIYRSARLFGDNSNSNVTYMLAGSGHIAGVVNHPSRNKYHHSINDALPETLSDWQAGAKKHPGSWWHHWMTWLEQNSDEKIAARWPGDGGLAILEDAPGSYVQVKA